MKVKILILISLITLLLFLIFKPQIIGFFKEVVKIYLSISPFTQACVYLLVSNETVLVESVVDIALLTENCGNQNFTGVSEITLFDSLNRSIFSTSSPAYFLDVYSRNVFKTSWFASPAGTYLIRGRVIYDNKTEVRYRSLNVVTPPPPPPPAPPVVPVPVVIAPPAILNFSIDFPKELNVTQAIAYPILILVNNTGTLPIYNLTLSVKSEEEFIKIGSISPGVILELRPGTSGIFLFSIFIHPETLEGSYKLYINVSDEIWRSGEIILKVKKLETKEKAFKLLRYYQFLIDTLENLARKIEFVEKRNVTFAEAKLLEAKTHFKIAEKLYDAMFYEKAIEKLDEVKEKLAEVVELLTIAPPTEIVKPVIIPVIPIYVFILPFVLIIATIAAILVWKRRRPIFRYKRW